MQMAFCLGPCPRYWVLNKGLKAFSLSVHIFPPKLALQNACLLSGPCITVESIRQILYWNPVEIWPDKGLSWSLITSDDPCVLKLPVSSALQMCLPRPCRLVYVCVFTINVYVFVCKLSGASSSSCYVIVYPANSLSVVLGALTWKQFPALLSKLWSGVRLPNAILRKGLFDNTGCDKVCTCKRLSVSQRESL